jgi:DNA polymerase III delta subunit
LAGAVPANLSIVAGSDEFLVDREARRLFEAAKAEAGAEADPEVVDGSLRVVADAPAVEARIRESLAVLGLFGSAKVVWIRGFNWLELPKAQAGSEEVVAILEQHLIPLLAAPPPDVRVVLSLIPPGRTRREFKQLKAAAGAFLDLPDPKGEELAGIAADAIRAAGAKPGPGAVQALLERVTGSTRALLAESEKLAVHAGPGGAVTAEDVRRLTPVFGDSDFFEPVDALLAADLPWTLDALERYFFTNASARPLRASLHNRLRLLIQLRAFADAGLVRLTAAGIPDRELKALAARFAPLHGASGKSSANPFSQNPWYLGTKVAPAAARFSLRELVDLQLDLADVAASGDEQAALRAACLRALGRRPRG